MPADFLFPGDIWFIAPKEPCQSLDELCSLMLCGFFGDLVTGNMVPVVYAFSDRDLADSYLQKAGQSAAPYAAIAMTGDRQLLTLLEELYSHGHRYLCTDAEQSSACILPILDVADQIRRRQKESDPDSDS
jgi:hypothetical protein